MGVHPSELEPIANRAWPARSSSTLGGWLLNAGAGWSMRSNACWPLGDPGCPVEQALDFAEAWYAERDLPPRFKLTDGAIAPDDLAEALERRGYAPKKHTLVMTGAALGRPDPEARVTERPEPMFEAVFSATANGNLDDARERLETLGRIPAPARFARIDIDGRPVALGAGAVDGDWVGIFGMRTSPKHRRNGLARRILSTLLAEAHDLGAQQAYLQVEADNAPAIALYEREGFRAGYSYRYWTKD